MAVIQERLFEPIEFEGMLARVVEAGRAQYLGRITRNNGDGSFIVRAESRSRNSLRLLKMGRDSQDIVEPILDYPFVEIEQLEEEPQAARNQEVLFA